MYLIPNAFEVFLREEGKERVLSAYACLRLVVSHGEDRPLVTKDHASEELALAGRCRFCIRYPSFLNCRRLYMAPLLYRQVRTFQLTPIRQVFQYCLFFFSLKLKVFMRHDFIITPIRLYYISISIVVHYNWLWEIFWLVAAFCLYHAHLIFDVRVTITYKHFQRHILIFRAQVRFLSVQRSQNFRLLHRHF